MTLKEPNEMTEAVFALAIALNKLGLADAATPKGAIEVLADEICNGCTRIADSIGDLAHAVREANESE